jgi:threonine dehydratase
MYSGAMTLPSLEQIREAQSLVYRFLPPTPQYSWPLINERLGCEAWIKHENHTPVGAFKVRGALLYIDWLRQLQPEVNGVVAATRGNHGQGVAMSARLSGMKCTIVVPRGNSVEKNRAMIAQGADLVEHGSDFQESLEFAQEFAAQRGYSMVPSFHEKLVLGTATYAPEFFEKAPELAIVYVPIGLGSSISGVAAVRNALGLRTEIVGVVAAASPSYSLSFAQRRIVEASAGTALADGLACRTPNRDAVEIIWQYVARIAEVSDDEIAFSMRALFQDTHNVAEGAAAASLAAAMKEKDTNRGKRIGLVLTGGNVDASVFISVLAGEPAK